MEQYYKKWDINKSGKPEIVEDLEISSYHEDINYISSSWMKEGLRSMNRFLKYPFKPKPNSISDSYMIGNMVHTYLMEHNKFDYIYHVFKREELPFPESTMNKKENKEYFEKLKTTGKHIVDMDTYIQVKTMCDNAMQNQYVKSYIENGKIENSIYWNDLDTGLPMKARPDIWVPLKNGKAVIIDIKTTDNAYASDFFATASKFNYPIQAAMQCDAVTMATGREIEAYMYLAIEKSYPYESCLYRLVEDDIVASRLQYKDVLHQILKSVETDTWPGYGRTRIDKKFLDDNTLDVIDVMLPAWHYNKY